MRYVVELWRTDDDRVAGRLAREGATGMTPFSGWIELFTLLEPPPLEVVLPPDPTAEQVGDQVS